MDPPSHFADRPLAKSVYPDLLLSASLPRQPRVDNFVLFGKEILMTSPGEEPIETETSEELQDEEAEERFTDESPAEEPHLS